MPKSYQTDDALIAYANDHSLREPEILRELREYTRANVTMSQMISAPEELQFLRLLAKSLRARKVLDVGVYTGYSALSMALALPEDGKVVAMDVSEEYTSVGRKFWERAGVAGKIDLHLRPATETLDELLKNGEAGTYDMAFIDADKVNYLTYFERCLELLRPGGIIAIDNVLWSGKVLNAANEDEDTKAIDNLNKTIRSDPRIELSMLVMADGVTVALKL